MIAAPVLCVFFSPSRIAGISLSFLCTHISSVAVYVLGGNALIVLLFIPAPSSYLSFPRCSGPIMKGSGRGSGWLL